MMLGGCLAASSDDDTKDRKGEKSTYPRGPMFNYDWSSGSLFCFPWRLAWAAYIHTQTKQVGFCDQGAWRQLGRLERRRCKGSEVRIITKNKKYGESTIPLVMLGACWLLPHLLVSDKWCASICFCLSLLGDALLTWFRLCSCVLLVHVLLILVL